MSTDEFEERLKALRPRLHRYCARMTGSAVTGEDVLQDTLVKALHARAQGAAVDNLEGWLFASPTTRASISYAKGPEARSFRSLKTSKRCPYPRRIWSRSAFRHFCGCLNCSAAR
jgi:DNA-directed RNA polymerase specialized sigma24 family protein